MSQTRELTDLELDAVSGGGGGFAFLFASPVTQNNTTTQVNADVFAFGAVFNRNTTNQRINIG
jgi:hypothetical protein